MMISCLAASMKNLGQEIRQISDIILRTDNWQLPAAITVAEAANFLGQSEEQIVIFCENSILPANEVNGQWMILGDSVLAGIGAELAHSATALLVLSSQLISRSDLLPLEVNRLDELIRQLSVLLDIDYDG